LNHVDGRATGTQATARRTVSFVISDSALHAHSDLTWSAPL
jgi:hypothetical protein